ncbi:hypothetical protein P9112_013353 [Eukaryota sp. TZLM1-RC]
MASEDDTSLNTEVVVEGFPEHEVQDDQVETESRSQSESEAATVTVVDHQPTDPDPDVVVTDMKQQTNQNSMVPTHVSNIPTFDSHISREPDSSYIPGYCNPLPIVAHQTEMYPTHAIPNSDSPQSDNSNPPTPPKSFSSFKIVSDPELMQKMSNVAKSSTRIVWSLIGVVTAILILIALLLIVRPMSAGRSELTSAVKEVEDLQGSTIETSSHSEEDKLKGVTNVVESALEDFNVDVNVRYLSSSDSFAVNLEVSAIATFSERVTLRNLQFTISNEGRLDNAMNVLLVSDLKFSISPFEEDEMVSTLEKHFTDRLDARGLLSSSSGTISVTVSHIENYRNFKLTLSVNTAELSESFTAEFLNKDREALEDAIEVLLASDLKFDIFPFEQDVMVSTLEEHFTDILDRRGLLISSSDAVAVSHVHNNRELRLRLSLNSEEVDEIFTADFQMENSEAVKAAMDLIVKQLAEDFELEISEDTTEEREAALEAECRRWLREADFDDFTVSINRILESNNYRIKVERGSATKERSETVTFTIIDATEITQSLKDAELKIKNHDFHCLYGNSVYASLNAREQVMMNTVQDVIGDSRIDVFVEAVGSNWEVTIKRANFEEKVTEIEASFNDFDLQNPDQIAGGRMHSAVLKSGRLYMFGSNSNGQLGHVSDNTVPRMVRSDVTQVALGSTHTLALDSRGYVYATGYNNHGQLGLGHTNSRFTFTYVRLGIKAVYAGFSSSGAISEDGTQLYLWGDNRRGQISTTDGNVLSASRSWSFNDGTTYEKVALGRTHTLMLPSTGKIRARGANNYGQLGDSSNNDATGSNVRVLRHRTWMSNPEMDKVVDIAAGVGTSFAIRRESSSEFLFYSWGYGGRGELMTGGKSNYDSARHQFTKSSALRALIAPAYTSLHLLASGTVRAAGENEHGLLRFHSSKTSATEIAVNVKSIAASSYARHLLAVLENGELIGWGSNINGNFGTGTSTSDVYSYVKVGCVVMGH